MTSPSKPERPPGEGERAARRGYVHQDRASARLIYHSLKNRTLQWIGLADRAAGIVDDLVIGLADTVVGHQFKRAKHPKSVGLTALFLGTSKTISELAKSYIVLSKQYKGLRIKLRYITNDFASTNDQLIKNQKWSTTAAFLEEWGANRQRCFAVWQSTRWEPFVSELVSASDLSVEEFDPFFQALELLVGEATTVLLAASGDLERRSQIEELASGLSTLVADNSSQDRWSRAELLQALGWKDRFALRFTHDFPVGAYVQRNIQTEGKLKAAIANHLSGYVSLLGAPGAGKSTLLQYELKPTASMRVVRYLAFVPGGAQGQGRGEADFFYEDVIAQFSEFGLVPSRAIDRNFSERQQSFSELLEKAGAAYRDSNSRIAIVIDGLDHIPREERPDKSLLKALPLPTSVPDGVLFVLGSQRLDLEDLPPAVSEQAGLADRRIDIAPLDQKAIAKMADHLGLSTDVSRDRLFEIGQGHPLFTRYLVQKLLAASSTQYEAILDGELSFNGDLQAVYDSSWRSVLQSPNRLDVQRVLALISYAQGPIDPGSLATATSDHAVEATLSEVGHLLAKTQLGWAAFHNSFRLYIRGKPVQKFGQPDPDYAHTAVYRTLSRLAADAGCNSPQRWLQFRYLYLAADFERALDVAGRRYFIEQFCLGRHGYDVAGDITDALKALKTSRNLVKLFDLLLAKDEIFRRTDVLEGASSKIDTYLTLGDLDAAAAALDEGYEDGKQWLVIDALAEAGEVGAARDLFEEEIPFGDIQPGPLGPTFSKISGTRQWALRALRFLDEAQISALIEEAIERAAENKAGQGSSLNDLERQIRQEVARADAYSSKATVEEVAEKWKIDPSNYIFLTFEAASGAFDNGDWLRCQSLLSRVVNDFELHNVPQAWLVSGAVQAFRIGDRSVARELISRVPLVGVSAYDKELKPDRLPKIYREMQTGIQLRRALSLQVEHLPLSEHRILNGVQAQLIALAEAQSVLLASNQVTQADADRLATGALRWLSGARILPGEDWFLSYLMPNAANAIGESILNLYKKGRFSPGNLANVFEELITDDLTIFRHWPAFRRLITVGLYNLDNDAAPAQRRLSAGLSELRETDPRQDLSERCEYATAFALIGDGERARSILSDLRRQSFGIYLAAKKDGIYSLWDDVFAEANEIDPAGRGDRADVLLRLMYGLMNSDSSSMAYRIARHVLFEASVPSASRAWRSAQSITPINALSWAGIIDALLRGLVARNPKVSQVAVISWIHLVLPWYSEPHASTTTAGQFIEDVIAAASDSEASDLEQQLTSGIETSAKPDERLTLLRRLERAAVRRGHGYIARVCRIKWEAAVPEPAADPEQKSYDRLLNLTEIGQEFTQQLETRKRKEHNFHETSYAPYDLRKAATRIIQEAGIRDLEIFVLAQPEFASNGDVALALGRRASELGYQNLAKKWLAPLLNLSADEFAWRGGSTGKRLFQARQIAGEPNLQQVAFDEFVAAMVRSPNELVMSLWDVEEIFPLFALDVPWKQMWDLLEDQIRELRQFADALPETADESVQSDEDLLYSIWAWALSLNVGAVIAELIQGCRDLLEVGEESHVIRLCDRLLLGSGRERMIAADLLTLSVENDGVRKHFSPKLATLVSDPDAGIMASGLYLAARWNVDAAPSSGTLPNIYSLLIPAPGLDRSSQLARADTRGLVIDDPWTWTAPWLALVARLAKDANVMSSQIRMRVHQLITQWGGITAFGHAASERLEAQLASVDLKLTYARPQSEGVIRALRHVIGELFCAGRLAFSDLELALHYLYAYPDKTWPPAVTARPADIQMADIPSMIWGDEQNYWLDNVGEDLTSGPAPLVFAEWRIASRKSVRVIKKMAQWFGPARLSRRPDLENLLDGFPVVKHLGELIPFYNVPASSQVAMFYLHAFPNEPSRRLTFCPLTGERLGWTPDPKQIHVFCNGAGLETVRTISWRDGVTQTVGSNEDSFAKGERIVMTEAGLAEYVSVFGPLKRFGAAWRSVHGSHDDCETGSRFAQE